MNPTDKHPHSPRLRAHADQLIQALDALPAPQTLSDILRHARAVMALDRLLIQLWKTPATRGAKPSPEPETPETAEPATPLNRQQRRALAAQDRTARAVKPASSAPWREAG